jgi:2-polyprenyl-3-methyl-5-hydroxy-6-metoxy-1,4-benzoquinol methylase
VDNASLNLARSAENQNFGILEYMSENTIENYGWDSAQPAYSSSYINPIIVELLSELGAKRVVDLGAGNGVLCSELASLGFQVVGVEYDKKGVDIAKSANPEIPFYNFGVQDNPADLLKSEKHFDAVISTEVIEHLFSPHLLPLYAKSVLRDGGHLIITTPYHGYLKNLALSILNQWDKHHTALWHGGHIKFWSRITLSQLLEQSGFRVVRFSGVGRYPYLWKSMVLVALKD